jgi:hypothetical protein
MVIILYNAKIMCCDEEGLITVLFKDDISLFQQYAIREGFNRDADL